MILITHIIVKILTYIYLFKFIITIEAMRVNEAARELEDPSWEDGSDFSITDFHCQPVNSLMEIDAVLVVTRECEEQNKIIINPTLNVTFKARGGTSTMRISRYTVSRMMHHR